MQQQNRERIEWPESVHRAFFFFSCLLRIFVYLQFPGGNPRLGARSVRVSDRVRDAASLHVSQSACYALSSWSVLNRKGRLSPWEGIHRQLVREFRSLKKKKKNRLSGFNFVTSQYFGTFWLSVCRSSTVSTDCIQGFSCSFFKISPPAVFPAFMCCFGCVLASGWASSAGTGCLCSGRTGCSTRSQEKSPVPFPKPCSMKLKAMQSRETRISRPRTWIVRTKTLK